MKTPRVHDFDPNAKIPPLGSPMDNLPNIQKPQPVHQQLPATSSERSNDATLVRPNTRTPERPNGKRIITRNSFEIYEDQMDSLRNLAYHEKMEGKLGSMSQMVREAIDSYLLKRSEER